MPVRTEISIAIDQAAARAVTEAMLRAGVNVSTPDAAHEFQHDLIWLRMLRKTVEGRFLLIVCAVCGGTVISIVDAIVHYAYK